MTVLLRRLYLQGPPLWDLATWLKERAEQYTTSPISRFRSFDDWSKFQERILKDAGKHRNRLWSGEGPFELYLMDLVQLMRGPVEDLVHGPGFPERWDPVEKERNILGGLQLAVTVLTPRQKESFQLESIIGSPREVSARAMNVDAKTAQSHLSSSWKVLRERNADVQALRWFVESGTEGHCPAKTKDVPRIEEVIAAEEEAAQTANDKKIVNDTTKEEINEGI
ncbi:hypothetical protein HRW23_34980 [Streptomyces lunaelactis]|nr:hypothetical protein [Streptomyces lunaelactis]NUK82462.1 hypothetical protein [Streptomyces lunaelactis]NUL34503.1 hypothetical protein [Streptomyces lunaelactis]